MKYYRGYCGFDIHLEDRSEGDLAWMVRGYGIERAKGLAVSRQEAFLAACACIDQIVSDPFRFPINLLDYPDQSKGEVATSDGEILGRWQMSKDEALEFVEFIPEGSDEAILRDHRIGILCSDIHEWHNNPAPYRKG